MQSILRTIFTSTAVLVAPFVVYLAACGPGGASSAAEQGVGGESASGSGEGRAEGIGATIDTGLSTALNATNFTADDVQRICKAVRDFNHTYLTPDVTCRSQSVSFAAAMTGPGASVEDLRSACQEGRTSCLAQVAEGPDYLGCDATVFPSGCTATIYQIEQCLSEVTLAEREALKQIPSCENLIQAETFISPNSVELPPCAVLQSVCPGLL